jgi:hypothetical protein
VNEERKQTIENNNRLGIAPNQIVQTTIKKHTRAQFVATWSLTIMEVRGKFHQNFLVGL